MLALSVGAIAVVLLASGLRLAPGQASGAVEPITPTTPTSLPASAASPTSLPTGDATRAGGIPLGEPRRTARQRAAGLAADGSAIDVPASGSGRFTVARQSRPTTATRGRLVRFDLGVEQGLAIDPDEAALLVAAVLDDDRSWRGLGLGRFTLVPRGATADVHAFLATPGTTDRLCAPLLTRGKVSCQNGPRVVLNAERWVDGADAYGTDTAGYRRYLVNHEFGHALGRQHVGCPGAGRVAPVMMQQTKGLGGCCANSWPVRTRG